jgi:nicotinamidase-related amidase
MVTALLLVDVQRNMLEGVFPVPDADVVRPELASLLSRARLAGAVVVHVQNDGGAGDPDEPFTSGWELCFPVAGGEPVIRKTESDAFTETDLGSVLSTRDVRRVVVAGMQSNYCIAQTSLAALRHGYAVFLAAGAHATYDEEEAAAVISEKVEQQLAESGVTVLPAGEVSFG